MMEIILKEAQLTPEEEELKQIQEREAVLKQQLDQANQKKVEATLSALSEAARKREAQQAEDERILKELALRKKQREEAEEIERQAREQKAHEERRAREKELAREKASREAKLAELERVQRERAKISQLESELRKLELELQRGIEIADAPVQEEITVRSPGHPLSKVLGVTEQTAKPVAEVSSVESAKADAEKRKAETDKPWVPARKSQRFVDPNTSAELEKQIKQRFHMNANPSRCDQLSASWDFADVMKALEIVQERTKGTPIAHDALFSFIENTLITSSEQ